ncbi:MAG: DNA repair ATPase, partial [Bacteroidota bacterium]
MSENTLTTIEQMDGGTYEIIRRRLAKQADDLRARMDQLNASRKEVFGAVDMQLLANDRITTENNCIPVDMVAIGNHFIFGYNVHVGLRAEIQIKDVFATYRFENSDHSFHQEENSLIQDATFEEDFHNLYRYYKDTVFVKFAVIGPHLFMVFRIGKGVSDIKTFKWAIGTDSLQYLGNRFDHEFRFPDQQEFSWKRTTREMHRRGTHPHVSVEDRAFVETVGGDLTIKVEDNTDSGKGIYEEPVDNPDQTLDDADIYYADLGNLIVLKVRPYQEKEWRYIIFNEKMQEALRVDSIGKACVMLPDQQGLIFANGYYLQTGEYKIFDNVSTELHFEKRIASDNGEDFLYMFYNQEEGGYVLLPYNLVKQSVDTPIHCNGFSIFTDGELCYFRSEETAGRHHVVQVWQTPYAKEANATPTESTSFLAKVGNKDLVRGMAECNELLTLLGKGDDYGNLYVDLVKKTTDILDSYYWIKSAETANLDQPLAEIREAAASAIDEFEKVRKIRQNTKAAIEAVEENQKALFDKIRRYKPKSIDQFVGYLAELRSLIGEIIGLKDLRYVDLEKVAEYETAAQEKSNELSESCVAFLLTDDALKPYHDKVAEVGQG